MRSGQSRPVSRVLSRRVVAFPAAAHIPLGPALPPASSERPGRAAGHRIAPLCALAPGGACRAARVATGAVRSYRTVSPLPAFAGGLFSVALSASRLGWPLASTLPFGARTFLRRVLKAPAYARAALTGLNSNARRDPRLAAPAEGRLAATLERKNTRRQGSPSRHLFVDGAIGHLVRERVLLARDVLQMVAIEAAKQPERLGMQRLEAGVPDGVLALELADQELRIGAGFHLPGSQLPPALQAAEQPLVFRDVVGLLPEISSEPRDHVARS